MKFYNIDPDLHPRLPNIRAFRDLNKAVINQLPEFTYHLLCVLMF